MATLRGGGGATLRSPLRFGGGGGGTERGLDPVGGLLRTGGGAGRAGAPAASGFLSAEDFDVRSSSGIDRLALTDISTRTPRARLPSVPPYKS
ncbi:MAG TPA: hypothetical protein PKA88_36900, partial [Polyangiaceae bacterium]|nr:hypothetical protein [Polyangiaceae bacterium]